VNTNRVVNEALHCARNGWRPATTTYVCGPMRDGGGYQSTHALWALDLALRNGCVDAAVAQPCLRALQAELAAAQPATFSPAHTLDIDLYAERVLMLTRTAADAPHVDDWVGVLLHLQTADGSWGVQSPDEPVYHRFHATAVTTWALAERYRRDVEHRD
jgi:hypothetical protein